MHQSQTRPINQVDIYRPRCAKCGTLTMLARITPIANADHDSRVYECPACDTVRTALVQFQRAS